MRGNLIGFSEEIRILELSGVLLFVQYLIKNRVFESRLEVVVLVKWLVNPLLHMLF